MSPKIFGSGEFAYELVEEWGGLPEGFRDLTVAGIGCDNEDNVYLLTRSACPIMVFSPEGTLIGRWDDADFFERPHGIRFDKYGNFFCADDWAHVVYKMNPQHEILMTLGEKDKPSDTGCVNKDYRTIVRSAGPFNRCTNIAIADNDDIYVCDGYGNARVHVFDSNGNLKKSWGEPGEDPGQFHLPHGIEIGPNNVVYVADRQNHRIQLFDMDGNYLDEWRDGLHRPGDIIIRNNTVYISECKRCPHFDGVPSRISIYTLDGKRLARFGDYDDYQQGMPYTSAHGLAVDSEGSIYIAEAGQMFPEGYFGAKKYRRV